LLQKLKETRALWIMVIYAIFCIVILKGTGLWDKFNTKNVAQAKELFEEVSIYMQGLGIFGAILYMFIYTVRPLILFPATVLTLFGGFTFGSFWGTIYGVIGAGIGAILAFMIARKFGRDSMEKILKGKKLQKIDEKALEHGFITILYMRILPFPFDGVNYGAGLSGIKLRDFALGTYIGIIPAAYILNRLGDSLREVGSDQFYVSLGLYFGLILFSIVYTYWKKRRKNRNEQTDVSVTNNHI
jgi:uncharacterized membrane protein YdjX (TVP38/TMEM64 family)